MTLREKMEQFFAGKGDDYSLRELLELLNMFNADLDEQELYIGRFVEQQVGVAEELATTAAREEGA